jgi:hypothetical protein
MDELRECGWYKGYHEKDHECAFEKMRLIDAFNGLGLSTETCYDDEARPAGRNIDCLSDLSYADSQTLEISGLWVCCGG